MEKFNNFVSLKNKTTLILSESREENGTGQTYIVYRITEAINFPVLSVPHTVSGE